MANMRQKTKVKYQFWLGPTHQEMLETISGEMGLTKTDTIRELLALYYKVKGLKLEEVEVKTRKRKTTKRKEKVEK